LAHGLCRQEEADAGADKFLAEMEQVVPWTRLVERLQPLYSKGERGRSPIRLERMSRIYFLQQ
jgi:IS5 family transposase